MTTFPIELPTNIAAVTFTPYKAAALAASPFTGSQQVQAHAGEFFRAEVTVGRQRRDKARLWIARLTALRGPVGTFLLGDPMAAAPMGSISGEPRVDGLNAKRSETLNVRDLPPDTEGLWLEGDYIQLGSGAASRLHMVLEDVASDSDGKATLSIFPSLRDDYEDGTPITITNCKGVFRLVEPFSWTESDIVNYGISFSAVEAI